ncbi:MAG: deoxyribonuclease IV [Anaerolineae bacterium]|nr:deoxyribonuclease IV [Anaerolineae bacterium]MCO5187807.1 deoxyribonuclease IV [Anaerolineae bacterium]
MRLGAQISAAGGVFKAFERAEAVGCETFMVYTKSNRQWNAKPLTEKDIAKYEEERDAYAESIFPMVVHAAYLINLASPDPAIWKKSADAIRDEIERAEAFGVEYLVMHPGSHMSASIEEGMDNIVRALRQVSAETPGYHVRVCLENMAGQGTNLGYTFEQLAYILTETDVPERMGVCFDTCHVFAAGYDIRSAEAYTETMDTFNRVVGLDQIRCFHFNDSKYPLDSRRDRHEHIGQGYLGTEAFANFVNDPRWADHPAHLETPKTEKDDDGNETEMDPVNLQTLRDLIKT